MPIYFYDVPDNPYGFRQELTCEQLRPQPIKANFDGSPQPSTGENLDGRSLV
ncbi:MAG TPA: hypothetical protein V6D16_18955 [Candidatus Obscuribacterales bacterium]